MLVHDPCALAYGRDEEGIADLARFLGTRDGSRGCLVPIGVRRWTTICSPRLPSKDTYGAYLDLRRTIRALPWDEDRAAFMRKFVRDSRGRKWLIVVVLDGHRVVLAFPATNRENGGPCPRG